MSTFLSMASAMSAKYKIQGKEFGIKFSMA